jgi:hypothetical protein
LGAHESAHQCLQGEKEDRVACLGPQNPVVSICKYQ